MSAKPGPVDTKLLSVGGSEAHGVVKGAIARGQAHHLEALPVVHVDVWRHESALRSKDDLVSAKRAIIVLVDVTTVEVQGRVQHLFLPEATVSKLLIITQIRI